MWIFILIMLIGCNHPTPKLFIEECKEFCLLFDYEYHGTESSIIQDKVAKRDCECLETEEE